MESIQPRDDLRSAWLSINEHHTRLMVISHVTFEIRRFDLVQLGVMLESARSTISKPKELAAEHSHPPQWFAERLMQ